MTPLDPCKFSLDATVKQHLASKGANGTCKATLVQIRYVNTVTNWTCLSYSILHTRWLHTEYLILTHLRELTEHKMKLHRETRHRITTVPNKIRPTQSNCAIPSQEKEGKAWAHGKGRCRHTIWDTRSEFLHEKPVSLYLSSFSVHQTAKNCVSLLTVRNKESFRVVAHAGKREKLGSCESTVLAVHTHIERENLRSDFPRKTCLTVRAPENFPCCAVLRVGRSWSFKSPVSVHEDSWTVGVLSFERTVSAMVPTFPLPLRRAGKIPLRKLTQSSLAQTTSTRTDLRWCAELHSTSAQPCALLIQKRLFPPGVNTVSAFYSEFCRRLVFSVSTIWWRLNLGKAPKIFKPHSKDSPPNSDWCEFGPL